MKKMIFAVICITMIASACNSPKAVDELNVLSFNIRMDSPSDGENQWPYRKDYAADLIKFYDADLCGAQEVLNHQLNDLIDRLPDYSYIGVGREDGKTKGEYAPILYKKDKYTVVEHGDFWLAEDMNAVGVKGWDAACERVVTWGIFKNTETGKEFFMLNTHLDHVGEIARHEGASLVLEQASILAKGLPVIITGDFNATSDSDPIKVLTNVNDPRHIVDSRTVAELRYGPEASFHSFGRRPLNEGRIIDYIFYKGNVKVLRHGVLSETKGNLYPSDHCPVLATLILE